MLWQVGICIKEKEKTIPAKTMHTTIYIKKLCMNSIEIPYLFPLCGCECLVAALACSFSKSTRVSLTCKRYGSLLTRVSHLSSPSDGLSSFPQDNTRKWSQGSAENSVPEILIPDGNRTRNLCVSSLMH